MKALDVRISGFVLVTQSSPSCETAEFLISQKFQEMGKFA